MVSFAINTASFKSQMKVLSFPASKYMSASLLAFIKQFYENLEVDGRHWIKSALASCSSTLSGTLTPNAGAIFFQLPQMVAKRREDTTTMYGAGLHAADDDGVISQAMHI